MHQNQAIQICIGQSNISSFFNQSNLHKIGINVLWSKRQTKLQLYLFTLYNPSHHFTTLSYLIKFGRRKQDALFAYFLRL